MEGTRLMIDAASHTHTCTRALLRKTEHQTDPAKRKSSQCIMNSHTDNTETVTATVKETFYHGC